MGADSFYTSNNLEKYPNGGRMTQCKKCLTMHVDNWNPDTYLWILQEIDVPYVQDEWNIILQKYGRDPSKVTGMTILGRYLSKMKLKQWKDYRWKDSEFLAELQKSKIEQAMKQQGYEAAEIAATVASSLPIPPPPPPPEAGPPQDYFDMFSGANDDDSIELTEEDKTYLRLKWGKTYKPTEWVQLEQLYEDMINSYDIQAAGDINTLKLACKCSLKSNQLLDIGDIDGAQKATKMYDSLMKSGKWTAAQNKNLENEAIDSVGELVDLCEKEGFIPRFYIDSPNDHADRIIEDLQKYTHDLITNESGLDVMFENALRQIAEEQEKIKEAADSTEEKFESELFDYKPKIIDDEAFEEFREFESQWEKENEEIFEAMLEEGI